MFEYSFIRNMREYVKIFQGYPCPAILCDKELNVYWANTLAKTLFPHLTRNEGLQNALSEFSIPGIVEKVVDNGSCTLTNVIPLSTIQLVFTPILRVDDMIGLVLQIYSAESLSPGAVFTASRAIEALGGSVRGSVQNIFDEMDSLVLKADFAEAGWVKPNLNRIGVDSYRILRVTGNLVDYAMLQSGSLDPRFESVDVAAHLGMLEGALKSMSGEVGVPLEIRRPKKPSVVYMDRRLIESATLNLLHNSFYFTRPGNKILFEAKVGDDASTVTISDRGVGIPKDAQQNVWRPFYAGQNGGGLGLGLPIAKAAVLLHGGNITLESEPGEGTTVTMSYPRLPPSASATASSFGQKDMEFDVKDRFSRLYTGLADAAGSPFSS